VDAPKHITVFPGGPFGVVCWDGMRDAMRVAEQLTNMVERGSSVVDAIKGLVEDRMITGA
jgi:hypothetical protein